MFVSGDLLIPCEGVEVSYYRKKPFIVDIDPRVAKAIESGKWKQWDGPGLVLQTPLTNWDSALLMLPNVGPAWVIHKDYSSLTLVHTKVQFVALSAT